MLSSFTIVFTTGRSLGNNIEDDEKAYRCGDNVVDLFAFFRYNNGKERRRLMK